MTQLNIKALDQLVIKYYPFGDYHKLHNELIVLINADNHLSDCAKFNLAVLYLNEDQIFDDTYLKENSQYSSLYNLVWKDLLEKYRDQPEIWYWAGLSCLICFEPKVPAKELFDRTSKYIETAASIHPYKSYLYSSIKEIYQRGLDLEEMYIMNRDSIDVLYLIIKQEDKKRFGTKEENIEKYQDYLNLKKRIFDDFILNPAFKLESRFNILCNNYRNGVHLHYGRFFGESFQEILIEFSNQNVKD